MNCQIIVLAAGDGTRMESDLPKVMHQVGGLPMIERVLMNAKTVTDDIVLVHSRKLLSYLTPYLNIYKPELVLQDKPLGTAHAVYSAMSSLKQDKPIAVIYGDNPLISADIIKQLLEDLNGTNSAVSTLSFERDNPGQYGRIITDNVGNFIKIVEFKYANENEKKVTLCNSGVMAFSPSILQKYLKLCMIQESGSNSELYLTKIIEVCKNHGEKVSYSLSSDHQIVVGVNTQQELLEVNNILKQEI